MDRMTVCETVDPGSIPGRRTPKMEGWPSGLWRTPRKRVGKPAEVQILYPPQKSLN